jgi:hypothetical protein
MSFQNKEILKCINLLEEFQMILIKSDEKDYKGLCILNEETYYGSRTHRLEDALTAVVLR